MREVLKVIKSNWIELLFFILFLALALHLFRIYVYELYLDPYGYPADVAGIYAAGIAMSGCLFSLGSFFGSCVKGIKSPKE